MWRALQKMAYLLFIFNLNPFCVSIKHSQKVIKGIKKQETRYIASYIVQLFNYFEVQLIGLLGVSGVCTAKIIESPLNFLLVGLTFVYHIIGLISYK